jgi:hypothetical protein
MLSCLGASVAGVLHADSSSALSGPKPAAGLVCLESFCATDIDRMAGLHSYVKETLQPAMHLMHSIPALYLEAVIAPQAPQLLAVSQYAGFDEMLAVRDRIAGHGDVPRRRAELESGGILKQASSEVLVPAEASGARLRISPHFRTGIVELCSFSAPGWRNGPPAALAASFSRAGIHPASAALRAPGGHLARFTYLIPFANMTAAAAAWEKLEADSGWNALQRESAALPGARVTLTSKAVYKTAPYSRLS